MVFGIYLWPHVGRQFAPDLARRSLAFGAPDVPVRVASWALKLVDRLVLQYYVPLSVVGLYSIGYTLGSGVFDLVLGSLSWTLQPYLYKVGSEESELVSKRLFAVAASYNAAVIAFLALGVILFAREILLVLATPRYLGAEPIVAVVAWASVFQALAQIPNRALYFARRTLYLPVIFVVPAATNIALLLLLVPRHGMMGAAWATLLAYPLLCGLSWWIAQRAYPIPYEYPRLALPLALAFVLSLTTRLAPADNVGLAILVKALAMAAFLGVLATGLFLTRAERERLRSLAGRLARRPAGSRLPARGA